MKQTIYIETTIPSYYHNSRTDAEMVVLSQWTRDWWDNRRHEHQVVTSSAVLEELRGGDHPKKAEKLALLDSISLLPTNDEVAKIVDAYIAQKLMPDDPQGDALHLAFASFYKCDILLSWNCRHIVNHHKAEHLKKLNARMGLHVPALLTPFELLKMEAK